MNFSRRFIALCCIFRSVVDFELIFACVWELSWFIFLHVDVSLLQHWLLPGFSFLRRLACEPFCQKSVDFIYVGLFLGYFVSQTCLPFCQNCNSDHCTLQQILKWGDNSRCGSKTCESLHFTLPLRIILTIPVPLSFHKNFRIDLLLSSKKLVGILITIDLSLEIEQARPDS